MFIIEGTLRQRSQVQFKDDPLPRIKVWVEHTSERDNGQTDLSIEELFLPVSEESKLPSDGAPIRVAVRPYPSGKKVGFFASKVVPPNTTGGRKSDAAA